MKKLKNILLVEDDIATNFLHQLLLEEMGLVEHISIAHNGQQALDHINSIAIENLPELILLDINMPLMDGFEFLESYEDLAPERKTGSILMMVTTSTNPDDIARSKQFTPNLRGFSEKPLTEEQLIKIWDENFND